jgi:hypothetical protein
VQRDPGHIQRENHQRELLQQNPDCRLELTEGGTVGRFFFIKFGVGAKMFISVRFIEKSPGKLTHQICSKLASNDGFYLNIGISNM